MTRRLLLTIIAGFTPCFAQTGEEGLVQLSQGLRDAYANSDPRGYLIDPQRILRGNEARERREFLKYHSGDSLIDLYVVLFKGEQRLIVAGDLTGYHMNPHMEEKPVVTVHYFMGRPDRAQMFLSPGLDEVVSNFELGRALTSAIERAKTGVSPTDELEKFMVQTSIRIYRMENLLNEGVAGPAPLISDGPTELSPNDAEHKSLVKAVGEFWAEWKFKLIGALLLLVGALLLLRWLRLRATYEFPESDAAERLGGAHGAGVGAVIEFGKTSKPPAAQLEKLKLH